MTMEMNSFNMGSGQFDAAYPGVRQCVENVEATYQLRELEFRDEPDRRVREKKLAQLRAEKEQVLAELSDHILDNDFAFQMQKKNAVVLSHAMKKNIHSYKADLLRRKVMKSTDGHPVCVVCGKTACSGDIFVVVHNDNSAACLDCCTEGTKLDGQNRLTYIN